MKRLNTLLGRLLDNTVILSIQDPIQLNDYSEPQPDLAISAYNRSIQLNAEDAETHKLLGDVFLFFRRQHGSSPCAALWLVVGLVTHGFSSGWQPRALYGRH